MEKSEACLLSLLIAALREIPESHRPDCEVYKLLNSIVNRGISELPLRRSKPIEFAIGPFGSLIFPYFKMGAIDTTHLFGLDELIIFAFYISNVGKYTRVADLGANVGLHSILLAKLGYQVSSFEPDPVHYARLKENVELNAVSGQIRLHQEAVADASGSAEFIRVVGNTTSSHLSGAKTNPYGELERFTVKTRAFSDIMRAHDLIKMDIEGYEATALLTTAPDDWRACDIILEIGSHENAQKIWDIVEKFALSCFVQQKGWNMVVGPEDLPISYKAGSVFLTKKEVMIW